MPPDDAEQHPRPLTVAVATDSTAYLPADVVSRFGIEVVPLYVVLAGRSGREGSDVSSAEVARSLAHRGGHVSTSRPTPGDFVAVYRRLLDGGADRVVSVHLSGELSGTWDAARATAVVADLPPASVAVLVTHGGTAGRLLEALLGLGPEHRRLFGPLGNCHWSDLSFQASGWRLMRHNVSVLGQREGGRRPSGDRGPFPPPSGSDAPDGVRSSATPEDPPPAPVEDADAAG